MKKTALAATLLIGLSLLTGSCCRKPLTVSERNDSTRHEKIVEYRDRLLRDTTYVRDSIIITRISDTVTVYRDRYLYRDRLKTDTVYRADTLYQTIYRDREVQIEVRHIPPLYRASLWLVIGIAGFGLLMLYRKFKN